MCLVKLIYPYFMWYFAAELTELSHMLQCTYQNDMCQNVKQLAVLSLLLHFSNSLLVAMFIALREILLASDA
jgi:hypothetical protein